ncbi:MAG: NYN domain-containing protein, partial [Desulfobacterales bacterium]|nr:NYN domain-containing protein [Desulfobacterales bacterium]
MSLHIIIDGYNLIRQSATLSDLDRQDIQLGREVLLNMLAAYKKIKRHKITVVFDGTNAPFISQLRDKIKGIEIKFSRIGELADTVIKRMALTEREKALVVSSDMEIVNAVASQGASTISSPMFE